MRRVKGVAGEASAVDAYSARAGATGRSRAPPPGPASGSDRCGELGGAARHARVEGRDFRGLGERWLRGGNGRKDFAFFFFRLSKGLLGSAAQRRCRPPRSLDGRPCLARAAGGGGATAPAAIARGRVAAASKRYTAWAARATVGVVGRDGAARPRARIPEGVMGASSRARRSCP